MRVVDFSLDGQVAIVTGGSKGLGLAIAKGLAEAGALLTLASRSQEALDQAAKEIESTGGHAIAAATDVTDAAAVRAMVGQTVEAYGTVDILVNNAGVAPFFGNIDRIRMHRFERYFATNFMGAMHAMRAVAPILLKKQGGSVLNVASLAGFIAVPGLAYYSTSKAALINLTRTAAHEWGPSGVRVNAIAPGSIETDMNAQARLIPDFTEGVLKSIPMGRWGQPEDVVGPAVFLCSPAAAWVNGAVLVVDGGQSTSRMLVM
jgi:NAD(P)-dependent dehydrogenase (short-subunit alcohol dehydrogenase family)